MNIHVRGDLVAGEQEKKQAGGDITDGVKIEAGGNVEARGPIAGRDVTVPSPGRTTRQLVALGVLILCIATGATGLLALVGMVLGIIDKDLGTKLVLGLLGTSALTSLLKALLGK